MLHKITEFLRSLDDTQDQGPVTDTRLAAAVLMLEVAHADHEDHPAENDAMVARLATGFGLDEPDVALLVENAKRSAEETVSMTQHVTAINNRMELREKEGLVRDLWRVAYADGELHHYEEHLIRKVADLLYVPHQAFIRTKLEAEAEAQSSA